MSETGSRRSAVVVGGGIGGLSTAIGLNRIGWSVTVLERRPVLREEGSGISLMSNGLRSLDQLGVGDAVRALSATMQPGGEGVHTPKGRRLMRPTNLEFVRSHGLYTIILLRPELHRTLYDALPASCLRTGAEVIEVRDRPCGGALVGYQTREGVHTVEADLVVAADGVNSRLRRMLWPDVPEPVYSGYSVWHGITGHPFSPRELGGTTWGRGQEFARMPLADGRVYWYAQVSTPAGKHHADERAEVLRRFGSWHDQIPTVIESTPAETILHQDMFALHTPLPSYVSGSIALLGDAAHAMTADLGQGACQALEDAVVLCAALAEEDAVPAALVHYDQARRPRTQMIAEASRRMARMKLTERPLGFLARNLAMFVTPPRAGERAMARIVDWQPPELPGPIRV